MLYVRIFIILRVCQVEQGILTILANQTNSSLVMSTMHFFDWRPGTYKLVCTEIRIEKKEKIQ